MNILKKIFYSLLLSLLSFSSFGETGGYRNTLYHNDWVSGQLFVDNKAIPRIATRSIETNSSLIFDLLNDKQGKKYVAQIIKAKNDNEIGTIYNPELTAFPCSVRVDLKSVFSTNCYLNDDNQAYYITVGQGLEYEFYEECRQGQFVRFKLQAPKETLYLKYSLMGFSLAFDRALSLLY